MKRHSSNTPPSSHRSRSQDPPLPEAHHDAQRSRRDGRARLVDRHRRAGAEARRPPPAGAREASGPHLRHARLHRRHGVRAGRRHAPGRGRLRPLGRAAADPDHPPDHRQHRRAAAQDRQAHPQRRRPPVALQPVGGGPAGPRVHAEGRPRARLLRRLRRRVGRRHLAAPAHAPRLRRARLGRAPDPVRADQRSAHRPGPGLARPPRQPARLRGRDAGLAPPGRLRLPHGRRSQGALRRGRLGGRAGQLERRHGRPRDHER